MSALQDLVDRNRQELTQGSYRPQERQWLANIFIPIALAASSGVMSRGHKL
jgi:hypothetical protein